MKLNMIVRYEAIDGSDTSFSGIDIEPWSAQFESDAVIKKSEYFIGMNYTSKNISFCRIKGASGANFEIHVPIETEGRFILKILTMPGSHFQISSALFAVIQQGDNIRKTQENYNFNVKKSTSKDRNATMIIHKMVGDKLGEKIYEGPVELADQSLKDTNSVNEEDTRSKFFNAKPK